MMSDPTRQGETPSVVVSRKRRISLVWIAPVLAAVAVGYMVHDALRNRGPMITIVFDNAEGIVAGKTPIKFEGVQVGTVKTVAVDVATGTVTLQSRLDASAHGLAAEGSQFWIQTPQIGASGISSLDTLISGPYVACLAGGGARRVVFDGLPDRPPVPASRPGLRISLHAEVVRDLRLGSPVLYRGITVGAVDAITLDAADGRVVVDAFVDQEFASLVRSDTVFWEVSGLQAGYEIGEGLVVNTDSIRPMLTGAVAFLSGPVVEGASPVANGAIYTLYAHPSIGWTPARHRNPAATDITTEMIDHLASILRKADEGGVIDSTVEAMNALRLASAEADRTLDAASRFLAQDGDLGQTVAGLGVMAVELQRAASAVTAALDDIEERELFGKADTLLTQLDAVAPDLVKAMADLGDTLERIDGLVRTNEKPLSDTIRALRDASLRLNALLEDLRANPSQFLSKPPSRDLPRSNP